VINKKYYLLIIKMSSYSRFSELDALGLRLTHTNDDHMRSQVGDAVVANLGSLFSDVASDYAVKGVGIGLLQYDQKGDDDLSRNNLSVNISVAPRNDGTSKSAKNAVIKLNTMGGDENNTYDVEDIDNVEGIHMKTANANAALTEGTFAANVTNEISLARHDAFDDSIDTATLTVGENATLKSINQVELKFDSGSAPPVPMEDEQGNPMVDEQGNPIFVDPVDSSITVGNGTAGISTQAFNVDASAMLLTGDTLNAQLTDSNVQYASNGTRLGIDGQKEVAIVNNRIRLLHSARVHVDTPNGNFDVESSNTEIRGTGSTKIGQADGKEMVVDTNKILLDHTDKVQVETATLDIDADVDIDGANLNADLTGSNKQYATDYTRIGAGEGKELLVSGGKLFLDHARVDVQATNQSNDISYVTTTGHSLTATYLGGNTQIANSTTIGQNDNKQVKIYGQDITLKHTDKVFIDTATLDIDADVDIDGANLNADLTGSNKQYAANGNTRIGAGEGKELLVSASKLFLDHTDKVQVETAAFNIDASNTIIDGTNFDVALTGSNKQLASNTTIGFGEGKGLVIDTASLVISHDNTIEVNSSNLDIDASSATLIGESFEADLTGSNKQYAPSTKLGMQAGEEVAVDVSSIKLDHSIKVHVETATLDIDADVDIDGANLNADLTGGNKQYATGYTRIGAGEGKELIVSGDKLFLDHARVDVQATNQSNDISYVTTTGHSLTATYQGQNTQIANSTTIGFGEGKGLVIDTDSLVISHDDAIEVNSSNLDIDASSATLIGESFEADLTGSNKQYAPSTKLGMQPGEEVAVDASSIKLDHTTKVQVETAAFDIDADATTLDGTSFDARLGTSNWQEAPLTFIGRNSRNKLRIDASYLRAQHENQIQLVTTNSSGVASTYMNLLDDSGVIEASGATFSVSASSNVHIEATSNAIFETNNHKVELDENMVLSGNSNISLQAANKITLVRDEDGLAGAGKIEIESAHGEEKITLSAQATVNETDSAIVKASGGNNTLEVDTTSGSEKVTVGYAGINAENESLLVNGSAKITGKLEVAGDLEYRSVIKTQLDLSDNIIRLNYGGGEVNDAGFIFADVSSVAPKHAAFVYDAAPGADAFVCQYVDSTDDSGNAGFVNHDPESEFNNLDVNNLADFRAKTILCKRVKAASDARLKKNVEGLTNAMEQVKKLRPVWYNWKKDEDSVDKEMGFIAQEIEESIPSLVHTEKSGYKSVEYAKMVSLLTKALQEQQEQIDALRAEVAELKKD
jgi:hypothetical protein